MLLKVQHHTECTAWHACHEKGSTKRSCSQDQSSCPISARHRTFFAGQHDDIAQGLTLGIERSKDGSKLAFLSAMQWKPKYILLASCHAVVEAVALHLVSPHATLFCLPSLDSTEHSSTERGHTPAWQKYLVQMIVQPAQAPSKPTHNMGVSSDLSISWSHASQATIPATPDMIVIPAEGEGLIQAVGSMLLRECQIIVSQHYISRLSSESAAELAAELAASQEETFLHMHISGWEVYAREVVVSSEQRLHLTGAGQGGVKIAYHVTAVGRYPYIIQEHFSRLIFSGLYDVVDGIYCFILGPSEATIREAKILLQRFGRKVIIAGTSQNTTQYERFTLTGMKSYLQPGDIFLYMHSKGLRYEPSEYNIYDWSFYMMYFLVKRYPVCMRLLSREVDVCGVDFHTDVFPHYSGNFWWTTADYYLSLPDTIGHAYLDPEAYLALGSPRHVSLWEANSNFHLDEYPPLRFVDTSRFAFAWQESGVLSRVY